MEIKALTDLFSVCKVEDATQIDLSKVFVLRRRRMKRFPWFALLRMCLLQQAQGMMAGGDFVFRGHWILA